MNNFGVFQLVFLIILKSFELDKYKGIIHKREGREGERESKRREIRKEIGRKEEERK
jgi:hypothetical protein